MTFSHLSASIHFDGESDAGSDKVLMLRRGELAAESKLPANSTVGVIFRRFPARRNFTWFLKVLMSCDSLALSLLNLVICWRCS